MRICVIVCLFVSRGRGVGPGGPGDLYLSEAELIEPSLYESVASPDAREAIAMAVVDAARQASRT